MDVNEFNYSSPSFISGFLKERELGMQKRFGQNFMISPHARTKLAEAMDIKEGEKVWEIGAGLGALTAELLNRGANVTVFEIDRGFIGALRELFARFISAGRLSIVEGDVMKSAKRKEESLLLEKKEIKIFGNLPYLSLIHI